MEGQKQGAGCTQTLIEQITFECYFYQTYVYNDFCILIQH